MSKGHTDDENDSDNDDYDNDDNIDNHDKDESAHDGTISSNEIISSWSHFLVMAVMSIVLMSTSVHACNCMLDYSQ